MVAERVCSRCLELGGTSWIEQAHSSPKRDPLTAYLCVPETEWEEGSQNLDGKFTHIFLLVLAFSLHGKDGGQGLPGRAGQGKEQGPQWSLPELAATSGSAGWFGKRVITAQICWRQVCTDAHQAGWLANTHIHSKEREGLLGS